METSTRHLSPYVYENTSPEDIKFFLKIKFTSDKIKFSLKELETKNKYYFAIFFDKNKEMYLGVI